MQDKEVQRELLKETEDLAHALRWGVNFEHGYLNQLKVSTIPPTVDSHNISTPFLQRECTTKLKKNITTISTHYQNYTNCDLLLSLNQKEKFIARGKICNS